MTDRTSITIQNFGTPEVTGKISAPNVTLIAESVGLMLARQSSAIIQSGGEIDATGTLTLNATSRISQTGGRVVAGTLTGRAFGTVALVSASNAIGTLGAFSSSGGFHLVDGQSLAVTGPVVDSARSNAPFPGTSPAGPINLEAAGALTLAGSLTAPAVNLSASGAITQTGGVITAGTLTGSAASAALSQPNAVTTLGAFTTKGDFTLNQAQALQVAGPVTGGGTVILQSSQGVTLTGDVTGQFVSLFSPGAPIVQSSGGITGRRLAGVRLDGESPRRQPGRKCAPVGLWGGHVQRPDQRDARREPDRQQRGHHERRVV